MRVSKKCIDKVTAFMRDGTARVTSVLCIGPVENPYENDIWNMDLVNIFSNKNIIICENDDVEFKNGKKCKCLLHSNIADGLLALDLSTFKIESEERLFLVFNIRCPKKSRVVVSLGEWSNLKIWKNDIFLFHVTTSAIDGRSMLIELEKGNNVILIEYQALENAVCFSMRVDELDSMAYDTYGRMMSSVWETYVLGRFEILCNNDQIIRESHIHKFSIQPLDLINIDRKSLVNVEVENAVGEECDAFTGVLYKPIEYDLSKIKDKLDGSSLIYFNISIRSKTGKERKVRHFVVFADKISDEIEAIKHQYEEILLKLPLSEEEEINFEGRLKRFEDIFMGRYSPPGFSFNWGLRDPEIHLYSWTTHPSLITVRSEIYEMLDLYRRGLHFDDFLVKHPVNDIYLKSNLDDQIEEYYVSIPKDHSPQNKYPLIVFVHYEPGYDGAVHVHQPYADKGVILVELLSRGQLTGGYIGEAAFQEFIEIILEKYSVDPDRIYLVGGCAGAYFSYAIAEAYPHFPAAIAVLSGAPYVPNLCNLSNIKVLTIVGDTDYMRREAFDIPAPLLSEYGNHEGIVLRNAGNRSVIRCQYSKEVIGWLLEQRREPFPKRILFRTDRIRHNRTYWLEIVEIGPSKRSCEVDGKLIDDSTIKLCLDNVNEFALIVPPFMNRDALSVIINQDQVFDSIETKSDRLVFGKKEGMYYLLNTMTTLEHPSNSLGTGLLDIYMDRLKIVAPSVVSAKDMTVINKVTMAFARPESLSSNPQINVGYQVVSDDTITAEDIRDCNLVIVDLKGNNKLLSKMRSNLPFILGEKGYEYNGIYQEGDYCLEFIISNPLNERRKVLIASSNNSLLFSKNMFTRKIIIPSYANGIHPFLNSEAIIYDGKEHKVVYILGDDITEVTEHQ